MYRGDVMIPRNGLMMPDDRNVPLSTTEAEAIEVRFPKLSIKQRKFAVNPGYMSYYNPDFEVIEDERWAQVDEQPQDADMNGSF